MGEVVGEDESRGEDGGNADDVDEDVYGVNVVASL